MATPTAALLKSPPEAAYYTPAGCYDLPFVYVYDASQLSLTNGTNVLNQSINIDYDSDFILRAILGANNIVDSAAGGIRLYNYTESAAMDGFVSPFSNQYAIAPEKPYPRSSRIKFDLQSVNQAVIACATNINLAQLAFQGVKRYRPGESGYASGNPALPVIADPSKYILKPYTYPFQLNLNWFHWTNAAAGIPDIPRRFSIDIQDYDFELHYITVTNLVTGARLTTDLFSMLLYDPSGFRPLATAPLPQSYWNNNRNEYGNPVFPVPPLVYPVWQRLAFDITSNVCNTDASAPYGFQICFCGCRRIPVAK